MLRIYRRHVKSYRFWTGKSTNGNRRNNNCRCPVWVDGYLNGVRVNRTLDLRDWTRANGIIRDWEIEGTVQAEVRSGVPVREACEGFLADAEAQRLSDASLKKYRVLLINPRKPENYEKHSPSLSQFCADSGLHFTTEITLPELSRFRGQWKDGAISGGTKLERLRAFGRFLVDRGWWSENLALKLKRPKLKDAPTMPFTRDEMSALLAACEQYTDWHGRTGQENACRLRAFILLARYSALRISDAASCPVDRLSGNRLFLTLRRPACRCGSRFRHSSLRRSRRALGSASVTGSGPASVRKRHSPETGAAPSATYAKSPACKEATRIGSGTPWR